MRSENERAFSLIDSSNSGYIEQSDLVNICTALGINEPQTIANKILKQVRPNSPGKISYDEFVEAIH